MTFSFKTLMLGRRLGGDRHNSLFGYLVDGLNAVGSLLIFLIMAMIVVDVLSRNVLNKPIAGVAELVAASIVMIVFLQLPSALRHGRMAQADIFLQGFTERHPHLGYGLQSLFHLAGAYVLMVVYQGTLPIFLHTWERNQFMGVEGVFTFPVWPIRLVVIACAAITLLQYLLLAVQALVWTVKGRAPDAEEDRS
ncbi:TRAP transporter small permease [Billgrantia pellis]|uniref:TRAP transporter small permease protein n=1 Tax=Billgrantia pellis TaxID=2606936 RepID=A0A7V7FZW1_9GAMM|nr:TRAP transporter small permease [Halomonas pellis]KAA0012615.1 TRAP transporter small permease [Halomonas pellis]